MMGGSEARDASTTGRMTQSKVRGVKRGRSAAERMNEVKGVEGRRERRGRSESRECNEGIVAQRRGHEGKRGWESAASERSETKRREDRREQSERREAKGAQGV